MIAVSWDQVRAWRLARQHLGGPGAASIERAAADTVGVHAQVASCAEHALVLRVQGATPAMVRDALWRDRTLVRTWAMRGTLHLLATSEYSNFVGALRTFEHWRRGPWLRMVGLTEAGVDTVIEAVDAALAGRCLTREQLADAVAAERGPVMRQKLLSGWGSLLKPAAYQGVLCSGPSQGQKVTFQRPVDWLGAMPDVEPQEGLRHVCRRYLAAYGPATHPDFAAWWGLAQAKARALFRSMQDEVTQVEVEGRPAWALPDDAEELRGVEPGRGSVRLLGGFDTYVMGSRPRTSVVPEPFKDRVSRTAGWISPVVLVDGVAHGVWKAERSGNGATITVEPFGRLTANVRRGIEREAERLAPVLGPVTAVRDGRIGSPTEEANG